MSYLPIIFALIVFIVAISFGIWGFRKEKKRTEAFRIYADDSGFTFYPSGNEDMITSFSHFELFNIGRGKRSRNLLCKEGEKGKVFVFDYEYTTGIGKYSMTYNYTFMGFQSNSLNLPDFHLGPEKPFRKIKEYSELKEINFDADLQLPSNYLLKGEDKERIRKAFNPGITRFFENNEEFWLAGKGDTFLFYTHPFRVKTEALPTFIDAGYKIFELFDKINKL